MNWRELRESEAECWKRGVLHGVTITKKMLAEELEEALDEWHQRDRINAVRAILEELKNDR